MRYLKVFLATVALVSLFGISKVSAEERNVDYVIRKHLPANVYFSRAYEEGSNVGIITEGYYPSSCYRAAKQKVFKDGNIITIKKFVKVYTGHICPMVIVPFSEKINLGKLKAGDYEILFVDEFGRDHKFGNLEVLN